MARSPTVSDEFAKKFATEKDTPYLRWVRQEGLEVIGAQYVANLRTVELKPWPRRGGSGVFINHDASRTSNDCYVCAIPPGQKLAPQRQLYEEMILILEGRGSTSVWNDAGKRITFEWKAGAMFAIPLNCWHQHFNGSGQEAARYVGVTNAPAVMNMYDDANFVFNSSFDFKNRFAGEPDYFTPKAEKNGFLLMWQEGEEPQRYDWQVGTLIVPPNKWFHQHFNTGPTPARYLAFKHEVALIRNAQGVPTAWISRRIGGDQIDYADERPEIRSLFAQELAKHGMQPRMADTYQAELPDLPPKPAQSVAAE